MIDNPDKKEDGDEEEEPKPLHRRHFGIERFYCGILPCVLHPTVDGFSDEDSVKTHLLQAHSLGRGEGEKGEDYFEGWQARLVYLRRAADGEQQARKAARFLVQANYTVEDFLVDAGDEPWPALGHE